MASNEITGARYIAEALKHLGVTHVFFMDAILRRTLVEMEQVGITRVLAHSEKAAAYMADAYARVTGRVGVCMAQSVGAANLAAGLQDAWLHRAPVLAVTGRKPAFARDRNAYQEVEHAPLYASVTKMHADVDVIDELPRYLEQAFREATDGTPRPVHLDLNGLGGQEIENATLPGADLPNAAYGSHPVRRLRPDPAEIEAAAARLAKARKASPGGGSGCRAGRCACLGAVAGGNTVDSHRHVPRRPRHRAHDPLRSTSAWSAPIPRRSPTSSSTRPISSSTWVVTRAIR